MGKKTRGGGGCSFQTGTQTQRVNPPPPPRRVLGACLIPIPLPSPLSIGKGTTFIPQRGNATYLRGETSDASDNPEALHDPRNDYDFEPYLEVG